MSASLVGSEMCIRDRAKDLVAAGTGGPTRRSPSGDGWARIDWVFLPAEHAQIAEVRASWREDLYDRACP
eukprot:6879457-Alexandrium_andersonii.AAC.1